MPLFKTFRCLKCDSVWEGILDVCASCGSRGAAQSGLQSIIMAQRPPGYAGGTTTPHSARSYDACMARNFEIMKISNCTHKDGVPHCTFTRKSKTYQKGGYMSIPQSYGQQGAVKAYTDLGDMRKDGYNLGPMMIDNRPFQIPAVHPEIKMGSPVGPGLAASGGVIPGTKIVASDRHK